MEKALAGGGAFADSVRANLATAHLSEPPQILSDPAWQTYMRLLLLHGKTIAASVNGYPPPRPDGRPKPFDSVHDFEAALQRSAKIRVAAGAHVLDPRVISHTSLAIPTTPAGAFPTVPRGLAPVAAPP